MILELTAASAGAYGMYRYLFRDNIMKRKVRQLVIEKWNTMIELSKNTTENNGKQRFEILDVFPKHYGFDAIVSLPIEYAKLRKLLPIIETTFSANAIVELSDNKKTAYLRVHLIDTPIDEKESIYFKWYKTFSDGESRNLYNETYKIIKAVAITKPNSKDIVGYRLHIQIPFGLSYEDLNNSQNKLSRTIGNSFITWDSVNQCALCEIITKPVSDDEKFTPVKCEPWEQYVGITHTYKPVMCDFKTNPNMIIGGKNNTGKTVAMIAGLTNLCYWHNEDEIQLCVAMISDKQDLRIFTNTRQCIYYAKDIKSSLKLFKYLINEGKRRNKLFETDKKFIVNIYEWNKAHPKQKLPLIYLAIDEITAYMEDGTESKNNNMADLKKECLGLLWKIARELRSTGIYIEFATQRGDRESIKSNIKGQCGNKICFYMPNVSSALTIFGDGSESSGRITLLAKTREAIVENDDGISLMKTLYLKPYMIEEILKDKIIPNKQHLRLDNAGRIMEDEPIVEKESKDTSTTSPTQPTEHEQKQNNRKDTYFKNKTLFKRSGE